jgi:hypothetical protein
MNRTSKLILILLVCVWVVICGQPAWSEGCGTLKAVNVNCGESCGGGQASANACQAGFDPCHVVFPGVSCGSCSVGTANSQGDCLIEGPQGNALSPEVRQLMARRGSLMYVPSCTGGYVLMRMDILTQAEDSETQQR